MGAMPASMPTLSAKPPAHPAAPLGASVPLPPSRTVLLLVDFINPLDFPEARRLEAAAARAAKAAARLKARLTRAGMTTIYANDNYGHWQSDFRQVLDHCLASGGVPKGMAQALAPSPRDLVILKPRHSAFFATPLELLLGQMRTKHLVIAGLAADICVQLTAMDANLRGFKLWVPADCTAAETASGCAASLDYMKRVLKARTAKSTAGLPAGW
jgi:nicotinamidase-related amidase